MKKQGTRVPVAIKVAKLDNLTKDQIKEIMREVSRDAFGNSRVAVQARLMRYLEHPNIVHLYGVAAVSEPLMIVMELVRALPRRVR